MPDLLAPWATLADLCSPCDDYAFDTVLLESRLRVASEILFNLTGRRWPGEQTDVVRPCARRWRAEAPFLPDLSAGGWWGHGRGAWGWCGCQRSTRCGCVRLPEIALPHDPVVAVESVFVDEVELDEDAYRIDDGWYLVRLDGDGWPCCQDMSVADDAAGAFTIRYVWGEGPDEGGVVAAAALACELALAASPETMGRCRLPKRVQSVSRQGVTIAILDTMDSVAKGNTGIAEVDLWIASVNIGQRTRRSSIVLPDVARGFRRTS